jgi:hypothetical protein
MGEGVAPLRRHRHDGKEAAVHDRDRATAQLVRNVHEAELGNLRLGVERGEAACHQKLVDRRVGDDEDASRPHRPSRRVDRGPITPAKIDPVTVRADPEYHVGLPCEFSSELAPDCRCVEGALAHEERVLDASGFEQAPDLARRRHQRQPQLRAEALKLIGVSVELLPGDRISMLEAVVDASGQLPHEALVVPVRAERRRVAARVMVAVVHSRLVGIARPAADAVAPFKDDHPRTATAEQERHANPEKPGADDSVVERRLGRRVIN